jgi:hypothetical protein
MAKPQAVARPVSMKLMTRNRIAPTTRSSVLTLQIGLRAFAHRSRDFLHARVACGQRNDPP